MSKQILFLFILAFIIIVTVNCDDTIGEIDNINIPDSDVSYDLHIQPILYIKCAQPCHNYESAAGNLVLESYHETVKIGIVTPYSPENSELVSRITGLSPRPMPPSGSVYRALTDEQVQGVITWIEEGAHNN